VGLLKNPTWFIILITVLGLLLVVWSSRQASADLKSPPPAAALAS